MDNKETKDKHAKQTGKAQQKRVIQTEIKDTLKAEVKSIKSDLTKAKREVKKLETKLKKAQAKVKKPPKRLSKKAKAKADADIPFTENPLLQMGVTEEEAKRILGMGGVLDDYGGVLDDYGGVLDDYGGVLDDYGGVLMDIPNM